MAFKTTASDAYAEYYFGRNGLSYTNEQIPVAVHIPSRTDGESVTITVRQSDNTTDIWSTTLTFNNDNVVATDLSEVFAGFMRSQLLSQTKLYYYRFYVYVSVTFTDPLITSTYNTAFSVADFTSTYRRLTTDVTIGTGLYALPSLIPVVSGITSYGCIEFPPDNYILGDVLRLIGPGGFDVPQQASTITKLPLAIGLSTLSDGAYRYGEDDNGGISTIQGGFRVYSVPACDNAGWCCLSWSYNLFTSTKLCWYFKIVGYEVGVTDSKSLAGDFFCGGNYVGSTKKNSVIRLTLETADAYTDKELLYFSGLFNDDDVYIQAPILGQVTDLYETNDTNTSLDRKDAVACTITEKKASFKQSHGKSKLNFEVEVMSYYQF